MGLVSPERSLALGPVQKKSLCRNLSMKKMKSMCKHEKDEINENFKILKRNMCVDSANKTTVWRVNT